MRKPRSHQETSNNLSLILLYLYPLPNYLFIFKMDSIDQMACALVKLGKGQTEKKNFPLNAKMSSQKKCLKCLDKVFAQSTSFFSC